MLSNYKQNLFATRSTLNEALTQANDLYGNAVSQADSIAMRTAVYVVLNTAIQEHEREVKQLTDTIEAGRKIILDLQARLAQTPDTLTALGELVDRQVRAAVAKLDVDGRVDNFLTHNLSARLDETFAEKFDAAIESWAEEELSDKVTDAIDLDDKVQEQIAEYFSSNTFSIEAR